MSTVTLTVNGEPTSVAVGTTVAQLVSRITDRRDGIAVSVNESVVTRSSWDATEVHADDRVELLGAAQGG